MIIQKQVFLRKVCINNYNYCKIFITFPFQTALNDSHTIVMTVGRVREVEPVIIGHLVTMKWLRGGFFNDYVASMPVCKCVSVCGCVCAPLVREVLGGEGQSKLGVCRARISCWIWLIWKARMWSGRSAGLWPWHTQTHNNKHTYLYNSVNNSCTHTHSSSR